MLPQNNPDRIRIALTITSLVANAGLLLPATLGTWACGNSSTITLTSAARQGGPTGGTRC